ncbi:LuxR C-terminal-related transcriptional regulator [Streptomyces sp. NPDC004959]|uniref:LuxR C-terminal-related transcriptional regulator n=1 Tax=Streptomyces sp. NPDC004959 TaxID=3154673 RepID=UPI0033B7E068
MVVSRLPADSPAGDHGVGLARSGVNDKRSVLAYPGITQRKISTSGQIIRSAADRGCVKWTGAMDIDQSGCGISERVDWEPSSIQIRILEGIAAGLSSGRLSRELYLSSKTIDYHVRVMSDKLQAPNRVALVSRAFVLQILRTDAWPPRTVRETVD